jgi:hypothetical protein
MVKLELNLPWKPVLAWPWGVGYEISDVLAFSDVSEFSDVSKKIVMFQVIFSDVSLFSDVSRHRLDVLKLDGEK